MLKSSYALSNLQNETSDSSKSINSPESSDIRDNTAENENPEENSELNENESTTENNLKLHQPSKNAEYFSNPIMKYTLNTIVIGSFFGIGISSTAASSCPNFWVALVKTLQLIEILGKFLYIPVIYQGWLLDGLSGINDIGDAVTLPEDIFLDKVDESTASKGKITIYYTSSYVIKTIPLTLLQVIFLLLLKLLFTLIGKNKKYIKTIYSLVRTLEWYTMEATLIDIFFYATLGVKMGNYIHSPTFWLDRGISIFIFSWAIFTLSNLHFKIRHLNNLKTVDHLLTFEKEIITEGLHPKSYNYSTKSKGKSRFTQVNFNLYINILFKIKIALLVIIIVVF